MANNKDTKLIHHLFPFLQWFDNYNLSLFRSDLLAGITVALILIPQSMAYAILAGLPPVIGLYAAAITPMLAAMWGSLRQLSTGPIAIMSLLVLTTLSTMAEPGSSEYVEMAILLTVIVGLIKLLVGLFRMGIIMSFISLSAVKGFTSAAALIIMSTQLPHLLGVKIERSEYFFPTIYKIILAIPDMHIPSFLIGISSLIVIFLLRKIKLIPPGLIALLLATIVTGVFSLDLFGVSVVGKVVSGFPTPNIPTLDMHIISPLLGPSVVIALISFVETYSVSKTISLETNQKFDINKEFVGQGISNLIGSVFQSYPVSGSFSRTAINYKAGAKTGISSVIASIGVILVLLFFTPLLYYLPKAALGAMVISAVFFLFHPRQVFRLFKKNRDDGIVAIAVFVLSLVTKPDYALLIGISISLIFFIWKAMHPRIIRVTRDLNYKVDLNGDLMDKPSCPQIFHLRSDNSIFFVNAEYTIEHLDEQLQKASPATKYFVLDFESVAFIDITAIEEIRIFKEDIKNMGIQFVVIGVHEPVMRVFKSTGFYDELDPDLMYENRQSLINGLCGKIDHSYCRNVCPYTLFVQCIDIKKEKL